MIQRTENGRGGVTKYFSLLPSFIVDGLVYMKYEMVEKPQPLTINLPTEFLKKCSYSNTFLQAYIL